MGTVLKWCLALVIGLSCTASCWADLILVFDPATKTAELSGTTPTVVFTTGFAGGRLTVWGAAVTIPGGAASLFQTTGMATYNSPTPVTISNNPNNDFAGYRTGAPPFGSNSVFFDLSIDGGDEPAPATVSGTGTPVDYSGFNAAVQNYFESLTAASPLVLTGNFTSSTITVYALPVPEPGTLVLTAIGAVALLAAGRRRIAS
jgi:hypothetical protein